MSDEIVQGPKPIAKGKQAMVSTQNPELTKAMVQVIKDGGNAVDATITGCILQNVLQPHMSTHSGIVDFLYWDESSGHSYFLNSISELPEGLPPFRPNPYLMSPATIPGFMPGMAALAERFGTKPWSYYIQPAIEAAEKGVLMTSFQYGCIASMWPEGLGYFPSGREFWFPNGFIVPVGKRWKMPRMAETLRRLAEEGPEYFTKGDWAKHFVETANEIGWKITMDHMAACKPMWQEPLRFTYKDYEMIGNPPPEMGGLITAYFLGVMEEFDLKKMGHYTQSAETLALIARMFYRERVDLDDLIQDPLAYKIPTQVFLSKKYHRLVAQILRDSEPIIDLTEDVKLRTGVAAMAASGQQGTSGVGSCGNCVVDTQGNWVTMLHTIGGGVPGLVVDGIPGYGGGGNALYSGPGRRGRYPINPILIMRDDRPFMTLNSPGEVDTNVPTVLLNILGFDMPPYAAIDAPRFHPTPDRERPPGWQTSLHERWFLDVENRLPEKVIAGLAKQGLRVRPLGAYNWHTGSIQLIWRDEETGMLKGATDPRRLGYAEGF
jgi:gamma-glutamyltranspeptidase/glutathione hydrolase